MSQEKIKEILEDAKNQLTNNKGILKDSPIIQQFVEARKKIDETAATKNPLVKEYVDIHKEAEKNQNTTIGRMTREMKNIAAQHMIYVTAIEMSKDEEEKHRLKEMADELVKHPAVAAYGKYIEGLRYLSGEIYEVNPDVEKFFQEEMRVPLQKHDSKYEAYRLGVEEYVKHETERLSNLEIELQKKLLEFNKKLQDLDVKEREEKIIHEKLLKLLNDEIALKKEREEFEQNKESMEPSVQTSKDHELVNKENLIKLGKVSFARKYGSQERIDLVNEISRMEIELKGIPTQKEQIVIINSPEVQEKQDEYQKAIAKMKARELFEKQMLIYDSLEKDFIGDYRYRKDKAKIHPFRDRQTPTTICIAMMLMDGYKLEDIMDPTALRDKKKKIGQRYIDHRQNGDVKWYLQNMYDGSFAMMDAFKKYVIDHKDELKTEQDLAMHAGTLGVLSQACFDMFQELSKCKEANEGNLYKTNEEFEILEKKISAYGWAADLGLSQVVKYEIDWLSADAVVSEMGRQLGTKMLLDEIQKKNPDIESVMIGVHEQKKLDNQLIALPEFRMIYGNDESVDIYKFSKDDFKQLAFMQSGEFIEKNNIRFDRLKYPTKVTKDLEAILSFIKKGENLNCIVSSNGKQLAAVDNIIGNAKDNSAVFNKMIEEYDKALYNTGFQITSAEKPEKLKDLKDAAMAYINAKREQKGYDSKSVPDQTIDAQMLGKEKGGRSIFTERGRDRYEFALEIVTKIMEVEKKHEKDEVQKQDVEIQKDELDTL